MKNEMLKLSDNQARAARVLMTGSWVGAIAVPVAGWAVGANPLPLFVVSALFALLGTLSQRQKPAWARIGVAQALVGQAIVLNAAFAGHAWQIDTHMVYFALLAATMILNDARATFAAAATIAVHHLVLTVAMPSLVYPSPDWQQNVPRTALHAVVVIVETAALMYAIIARNMLDKKSEEQKTQLAVANAEAEGARETAEAARAKAEAAQKISEQATKDAEESLQHAKDEGERARQADLQAREASERDAAVRAQAAEQQKIVVDALSQSLRALRNCDLSAKIDQPFQPEYESLRDDFNVALSALSEALESVLTHAQIIGSETSGLIDASNDLSKRTEDQAATLAEITATVTGLTRTVESTASGARDAQEEVGKTKTEAANSAGLMQQAVAAMKEIEEASKQIQNIVGVIDEISFQTNLLALNAGVEAARAGDAGLGFAVVASEVRALAQRSKDAAQDIKALITRSDDQVNEGVKLVNQTGDANKTVVTAVESIVALIANIADSSEEQSASLGEISNALSNLDQATQSNAEMFEETSTASETLSMGVENLVSAISAFVATDAMDDEQSSAA